MNRNRFGSEFETSHISAPLLMPPGARAWAMVLTSNGTPPRLGSAIKSDGSANTEQLQEGIYSVSYYTPNLDLKSWNLVAL